MNEWKEFKLGDIAKIGAGGTPSRAKLEYWGGDIPWLKIGNLKEFYVTKYDETITDLGLKNSSTKLFQKGTVLISIFASLGNVAILGIEATTNQAIAGIYNFEKNISKEYVAKYLHSIKNYFLEIGRGVAQKNINLTILRDTLIKIPVKSDGTPDLKKQEEIVSILEKAEELKSKRKKAEEILDEYLKAVFYNMFLRDKNKFEEIELQEVSQITMGQSPPGDSYNEDNQGSPFFQGKSEFTERYPVVKKWTTNPTKFSHKGSILISVRAPVGSVNICNIECCIGRGLASINPGEGLKLDFLFNSLKVLHKEIEDLGMGSTFKAITGKQLREIKIPNPKNRITK